MLATERVEALCSVGSKQADIGVNRVAGAISALLDVVAGRHPFKPRPECWWATGRGSVAQLQRDVGGQLSQVGALKECQLHGQQQT